MELGDRIVFVTSGKIVADNSETWLVQLDNIAVGEAKEIFLPPQVHIAKTYPSLSKDEYITYLESIVKGRISP